MLKCKNRILKKFLKNMNEGFENKKLIFEKINLKN